MALLPPFPEKTGETASEKRTDAPTRPLGSNGTDTLDNSSPFGTRVNRPGAQPSDEPGADEKAMDAKGTDYLDRNSLDRDSSSSEFSRTSPSATAGSGYARPRPTTFSSSLSGDSVSGNPLSGTTSSGTSSLARTRSPLPRQSDARPSPGADSPNSRPSGLRPSGSEARASAAGSIAGGMSGGISTGITGALGAGASRGGSFGSAAPRSGSFSQRSEDAATKPAFERSTSPGLNRGVGTAGAGGLSGTGRLGRTGGIGGITGEAPARPSSGTSAGTGTGLGAGSAGLGDGSRHASRQTGSLSTLGASRSSVAGRMDTPASGFSSTSPSAQTPASSLARNASLTGGTALTSGSSPATSTPRAAQMARPSLSPSLSSSLGASRGPALGNLRGEKGISDEEFNQLQEFIYTQCGIFIADTRKYLVENRLANRLRDLNLKSFNEYYYYLRFDKNKSEELQKLFNVITTNETSFYRNPPQLKVFQDVVVPQELEKIRASGQRKLRIWSAGCSTGEEPYTLAIILKEVLQGQLSQWDIKITANDLSENVLRAAQRGIYSEYALRTTPPEIVERHFIKEGATFHIDPALKRMVSFGSINLSNKAMLKRVERSHIVFCRNVIIYFDEEMKRQVIESFYDNLLPGGCMLIGHSESLHNLSRAFTPEHHPGTIVYRKQE